MDPNLLDQLQQSAQLQQQARTNQHLREINEKLAAEQALPKCPYCGGGVIIGFSKCRNCAANLIWDRGYVAVPGQEKELREMVDKEILRQLELSNQRAKAHARDTKIRLIIVASLITFLILIILFYLNEPF